MFSGDRAVNDEFIDRIGQPIRLKPLILWIYLNGTMLPQLQEYVWNNSKRESKNTSVL